MGHSLFGIAPRGCRSRRIGAVRESLFGITPLVNWLNTGSLGAPATATGFMGPEPADIDREPDTETAYRVTKEAGEADEQERSDMLLNGSFRVAEHTPVFTREEGTGTTSICTTFDDYKRVSDLGKAPK